jgi:hypothetical protein
MLINPDVVKSASFLVSNGTVSATVFFVEVPLGEAKHDLFGSAHYAVTTYHSLLSSSVAIRFNLKNGGSVDKGTLRADWIERRSVEVAVLPLDDFPLDDYDIEWIKLRHIADSGDYLSFETIQVDEPQSGDQLTVTITGMPYGTGDEVFSVGLFEGHSGQLRAQPAVRFGHIALRPAEGEKVLAQIEADPAPYVLIEGYLIEMSTWQGQSGSPVFFRPHISEERSHKRPGWEVSFLVGMIQGMYPGREWVKGYTQQSEELNIRAPFNMGIGIAIPAKNIVEVLMDDKLKNARAEKLKTPPELRVRPSRASISADEGLPSRESFDDVLRRVSSKVSEPESEKK